MTVQRTPGFCRDNKRQYEKNFHLCFLLRVTTPQDGPLEAQLGALLEALSGVLPEALLGPLKALPNVWMD